MSKIPMIICDRCGEELPITEFKNDTKTCKRCLADDRISHRTQERAKNHKRKGEYKLTPLDKAAIECSRLGISYGQWQTQQTIKKQEREEQLNGRKTLTGHYRKHNETY